MADNRVKIVDIQVNVEAAIADMGKYGQAIDEARDRMKKLKKMLDDGNISTKKYQQEIAFAKEEVRSNSKAVSDLSKQIQNQVQMEKQQQGSLRQLRAELSQAKMQYESLSKAERESAQGDKLKAHISSLKSEIASASTSAQTFYKNVGNTSAAEQGVSSLGSKFKSLAGQMAMMATGGGIMQFSKSSIEFGRQFYDQMANVKAVTQATGTEMQTFTDRARDLGRSTKFHATDAAAAMETLARGGFNTNETLTAINTTLQMAQANAVDLNTASDIMIRTMRGFRMPITEEEMQRASDVLSQASRKSATNITEMGEAFKNAAPFAGALNIPIEQISAALGVMADSGTRGADAGTAMRMALLGIAVPTSKAGKVFKEFGINLDQAALKSKGLAGVLDELNNSGIFKDKESMNKLSTIFGRRAVSNVINLIGNLDQYKKKLTEIENSAGTTAQMFQQSLDPASNAIYTLSSAFEDLKIGVYDMNRDTLKGLSETLTNIIYFTINNLPTIANIIRDIAVSFGAMKLGQTIIAQVAATKAAIITNAEQTTQALATNEKRIQTLNEETATLKKTLNGETAASDKMTATERLVAEQQLATKIKQLEIEKANTAKLQQASIVANAKVAAVSTATGWKGAMASAGLAFRGFATVAKTAIASIGIMLAISLVVEGIAKLISYVSKMRSQSNEVQKAHDAMAKAIKEQNAQITKSVSENAAKEKARLDLLRAAAANANNPMRERIAAINKLNKIVPQYHGQISKSGKLFNENKNAIDNYVKGLENAARAEAAYSLYVERQRKVMELELTKEDAKRKIRNVQNAKIARGYSADAEVKTTTKTYGFGEGTTVEQSYSTKGKNGKSVTLTKSQRDVLDQDNKFIDKLNDRIQIADDGIKQLKTGMNDLKKQSGKYWNLTDDGNKNKGGKVSIDDDGSSSSTLSEKELKKLQREREKRQKAENDAKKKEVDYIKQAHDSMYAVMEDTIEKQRRQTETKYNDEINKLKVKLQTEKNLTEKARQAINDTIKYKEEQKNRELAKLDDQAIKEQIAREQRLINSRLAIIQKGSQEELDLKKESILEQQKLDLHNLDVEQGEKVRGVKQDIGFAKEDMDKAKSKLDTDKANGADAETLAADQQAYNDRVAAYQQMQQNLTDLTAYYTQMRADIEEKARQDTLSADQAFATQQEANRQMAFQTEMTERQTDLLNNEEYQAAKRALQEMGLDVVNDEEMNNLEKEREDAQAHLEFIQEQGQLENETQEQYNQRLAESKQALAQKNAEINNAEIKNEQAKQKAFQAVGNSLVSVFDAVGESNSAFAKMSKVIALAQIAIDTGKALSSGIASASSLPYPANLAAIATTIATVLANVATAISTVKSAKFAEGGKVTGPGTGTSDSIPARLSNGEYVMTAKATKMYEPLLAAMNGIGSGIPMQVGSSYRDVQNTTGITDSFIEAAATIRPVVSVEEITNTQNRVETIQNIDSI